MKKLFLIFTLGASFCNPIAALADCAAEIRAMYEKRGDIGGVTYVSTTEMNGTVVMEHRGWHQDYTHNMSEAVGRNMWFMVYGDTSWDSTDGKTWTKAQFQDPDWEAKSRANHQDLLDGMTDMECLGAVELEGLTVEEYSYVYKADQPYETHAKTTVFYNRDANFIFRTIHEDRTGTGAVITHTYTKDDSVVIPSPGE